MFRGDRSGGTTGYMLRGGVAGSTLPFVFVAQRTEHRVPNPKVAGSIPAGGTYVTQVPSKIFMGTENYTDGLVICEIRR
jgi:hypothetical protein